MSDSEGAGPAGGRPTPASARLHPSFVCLPFTCFLRATWVPCSCGQLLPPFKQISHTGEHFGATHAERLEEQARELGTVPRSQGIQRATCSFRVTLP